MIDGRTRLDLALALAVAVDFETLRDEFARHVRHQPHRPVKPAELPDGHIWLRVTRPEYANPFDPTFAQQAGGRRNPPNSWPTLYLDQNIDTVHAQLRHMFTGRAIDPDDLDDNAPIHLAAAGIPDRQIGADVHSLAGIADAGLDPTYPYDANGDLVEHDITQSIGTRTRDEELNGVWCTSATGTGREFAWFPTGDAAAVPHWGAPRPSGAWRDARSLADIPA